MVMAAQSDARSSPKSAETVGYRPVKNVTMAGTSNVMAAHPYATKSAVVTLASTAESSAMTATSVMKMDVPPHVRLNRRVAAMEA